MLWWIALRRFWEERIYLKQWELFPGFKLMVVSILNLRLDHKLNQSNSYDLPTIGGPSSLCECSKIVLAGNRTLYTIMRLFSEIWSFQRVCNRSKIKWHYPPIVFGELTGATWIAPVQQIVIEYWPMPTFLEKFCGFRHPLESNCWGNSTSIIFL